MNLTELEVLRVSVARIAQVIGADNSLEVTDKGFSELGALARAKERGWNDLAHKAVIQIEYLKRSEQCSDESYRWVAEQLKDARAALDKIKTIAGIFK
jgi:hypothetical protein